MATVDPSLEENPNLQDVHALLASFNEARYLETATLAEAMTRRCPQHPFGWKVLSAALSQLGRNTDALTCAQKVVALAPADAEAHNNLGAMLRELGRLGEAVDCSRRALTIRPDYAEAHNNLGVALKDLGRFDEAVASYRRALELKPDSADAHCNLGIALNALGRIDEAVASYRRALALKPDLADAHSNLIFALLYQAGNNAELMAAELRRWNERHAVPLARFILPHTNDRSPGRRLRVGYVSYDFIRHPVAFFLLPLLEAHDRERFHVSCYTTNPRTDDITQRLQACTDAWHNLAGASDEAIARQVREDRIDLLVDLSGHTAGNRLRVFARKPAPVQISYLGFPCATGLGPIDYRLTDRWADPSDPIQEETAEQLARLPETAWCFSPLSGDPPVGDLPATQGTQVTFGCFNNFAKVTDDMLQVWARILQRVPGSRLVLKNAAVGNASVVRRVQDFFAQRGIGADRLELLPPLLSPMDHLECYDHVDVALDTFPYHGTTTTCEALWMGVPVITLAGSSHVARVGVSLLANVGLSEFVACSVEDYVDKAIAVARDLPRLTGLRAGLRERMRRSPLMDGAQFARGVESAYRTMWHRWCARQDAAQSAGAPAG